MTTKETHMTQTQLVPNAARPSWREWLLTGPIGGTVAMIWLTTDHPAGWIPVIVQLFAVPASLLGMTIYGARVVTQARRGVAPSLRGVFDDNGALGPVVVIVTVAALLAVYGQNWVLALALPLLLAPLIGHARDLAREARTENT